MKDSLLCRMFSWFIFLVSSLNTTKFKPPSKFFIFVLAFHKFFLVYNFMYGSIEEGRLTQ